MDPSAGVARATTPDAQPASTTAQRQTVGPVQTGTRLRAGSVPVDQAPFNVAAIIEQARSTFETTEEGFSGGRAEYAVRVSSEGIALKARHWQPRRREERRAAPGEKPGEVWREPRQDEPSAREQEKPVESQELVLRTAYVGRGATHTGSLLQQNVAVPEEDARLLAWKRSDHTEHLRQTPQGVEQSWQFPAAPEGDGELVVRVAVSGMKHVSETARGLHFADARGLGFGYGHGTWIDASGVKTAVSAHYRNGSIELAVPREVVERSAYPAVLDPVVGPESIRS
jgi:hypothetical protein